MRSETKGRVAAVVWLLAASVIIGACIGLAIAQSGKASATPMSYLQSLNNHGLYVYDTAAALTTGYTICQMLNNANGEQVAEYVYTHTSWSDVPDVGTAAVMVVVAVEELCPQHDHRNSAAYVA